MGIERDFLMRQLLMLFDVIHKILNHRKKGEDDEAEHEIQYFYECLKIDQQIQTLKIEELVQYLTHIKKLTNEHIEMIAFVIKEQGELEKDSIQKKDYFRKSLFLLEKVEHESISFSMDRQIKLAELKEFLS